jgi:hypothetical protein
MSPLALGTSDIISSQDDLPPARLADIMSERCEDVGIMVTRKVA